MKYHTYSEALRKITSSAWEKLEAFDLAGLRKKIGDNLVEKPGMPDKIFLPSEMQAAEMRAKIMNKKLPDLVVTLVCQIKYDDSKKGIIHVESVLFTELEIAVECIRERIKNGAVDVLFIYCEESSQLFYDYGAEWPLDEQPRLPAYGQKYDRKRKAYRME